MLIFDNQGLHELWRKAREYRNETDSELEKQACDHIVIGAAKLYYQRLNYITRGMENIRPSTRTRRKEPDMHTLGPLKVDFNPYDEEYRVYQIGDDPRPVTNSMFKGKEAFGDCNRIVLAVNNFDAMKAALEEARRYFINRPGNEEIQFGERLGALLAEIEAKP